MDVGGIIVIILTCVFVFGYLAIVIYRRIKGLPSINDECASEHRGKALVAAYRAAKKKEGKALEKKDKTEKSSAKPL